MRYVHVITWFRGGFLARGLISHPERSENLSQPIKPGDKVGQAAPQNPAGSPPAAIAKRSAAFLEPLLMSLSTTLT